MLRNFRIVELSSLGWGDVVALVPTMLMLALTPVTSGMVDSFCGIRCQYCGCVGGVDSPVLVLVLLVVSVYFVWRLLEPIASCSTAACLVLKAVESGGAKWQL